jgi:hypothetical protein
MRHSRRAEAAGYIGHEDMTQILMAIVCANSGHFRSTRQRENLASGVACCLKSTEASDMFRRMMKVRWSFNACVLVGMGITYAIVKNSTRIYGNFVA